MKDDMTPIIGNGMIAQGFSQYTFSTPCVVIASGVANSLEHRISEFAREEALIQEVLTAYPQHKMIYFSTCSILQKNKTPYINHKLAMENLISKRASSFLLCRLPQAVGVAKNMTLIPFLVSEILKSNTIKIHLKAKRNLIDIEDVARVVQQTIESNKITNSIINIAAKHGVEVSQIVSEIGQILNKPYTTTDLDIGETYDIPIDFLEHNLPADDLLFGRDYWRKTLTKYVSAMATFR